MIGARPPRSLLAAARASEAARRLLLYAALLSTLGLPAAHVAVHAHEDAAAGQARAGRGHGHHHGPGGHRHEQHAPAHRHEQNAPAGDPSDHGRGAPEHLQLALSGAPGVPVLPPADTFELAPAAWRPVAPHLASVHDSKAIRGPPRARV